MIERGHLKKKFNFYPNNFKFSAVKKIIYNNIAWKYGNVTVKDFQKRE